MPQLPTITVVTPWESFSHHLWVADDAGIVVGVNIDEARRKDLPFSLCNLPGNVMRELSDRANGTGFDGDIRCLRLGAATIEDPNVPNERVAMRHMAWHRPFQ